MTVGDGIFWSTLFVLFFAFAYLVSKHTKWKLVLKILIFLFLFSAVVGASIWAYNKYEERPYVATELGGIKLGMSEVDVTLAKGAPSERLAPNEPKDSDFFSTYLIYGDISDSYTVAVLRGKDKDNLKVDTICEINTYTNVQGFNKYRSENSVIDKLGKPGATSIDADGISKRITYPDWNSAFTIEKGKVTEVCVTSREAIRFTPEYGDEPKKDAKKK